MDPSGGLDWDWEDEGPEDCDGTDDEDCGWELLDVLADGLCDGGALFPFLSEVSGLAEG